jgi:hypothetical protein
MPPHQPHLNGLTAEATPTPRRRPPVRILKDGDPITGLTDRQEHPQELLLGPCHDGGIHDHDGRQQGIPATGPLRQLDCPSRDMMAMTAAPMP